MNIKLFTGLFFTSCMMISCNDSTDNIGSSLAGLTDGVKVESASFDVSSQSIIADSVLSRNTVGYLGKVLDPETGSYVTGDFIRLRTIGSLKRTALLHMMQVAIL